ncbi:MAG TPA: hypothetical protein VNI78_05195 [Vicinamibacterales bacterium]|nr:hypothetical protein [Vicinamibacterales bacterium]
MAPQLVEQPLPVDGALPRMVQDVVFSSETRSLGEIQDLALNGVRPMLGTLPGVPAPPPFGNQRTAGLELFGPDACADRACDPPLARSQRRRQRRRPTGDPSAALRVSVVNPP